MWAKIRPNSLSHKKYLSGDDLALHNSHKNPTIPPHPTTQFRLFEEKDEQLCPVAK